MSSPRFYFASVNSGEQQDRSASYRNPPLFWRRLAVGMVLMMPGTFVGLLIALAAPRLAVPFSILGAVVGFLSGIYIERR